MLQSQVGDNGHSAIGIGSVYCLNTLDYLQSTGVKNVGIGILRHGIDNYDHDIYYIEGYAMTYNSNNVTTQYCVVYGLHPDAEGTYSGAALVF